MQEEKSQKRQERNDLHSTLVRFYAVPQTPAPQNTLYLHSTLVRFYGLFWSASQAVAVNLHSTLVRFYDRLGLHIRPFFQHLHSTLVRFYVWCRAIPVTLERIYIPHWLDSMMADTMTKIKDFDIYIPHWLDSMGYGKIRSFCWWRFTFHTG